MNNKTFAETLTELRKSKGHTQQSLFCELHVAGIEIPLKTLQNWEQGKKSPPIWVQKLLLEKIGGAGNAFTRNETENKISI